jgi:hypothetical protein
MHLGAKLPLLAIFLAGLQLFAQSEVGTTGINGTITDPSGAIVGGAKITATNAGKNFTRQTTNTAAGLYSLGNYRSAPTISKWKWPASRRPSKKA